MEINTRIGVKMNIKGYNEETKVFDVPLVGSNGAPVNLTGSTITFKTKGVLPSAPIVTHSSSEVIVSPSNSTHLRFTLTSLPRMDKLYEVKIARQDGIVIVLDGRIEITDTV